MSVSANRQKFSMHHRFFIAGIRIGSIVETAANTQVTARALHAAVDAASRAMADPGQDGRDGTVDDDTDDRTDRG